MTSAREGGLLNVTVEDIEKEGVLQGPLHVICIGGVRPPLKIEVCIVVDLHCYIRLHAPLCPLWFAPEIYRKVPSF